MPLGNLERLETGALRGRIGFRRSRREAVFPFWGPRNMTTALPLTLPGQVKQRIRFHAESECLWFFALGSAVSAIMKAHMSTIVRIAIMMSPG